MNKVFALLAVAILFIPLHVIAGDDASKPAAPPITETHALWLGPVKLGVLPPPPIPPWIRKTWPLSGAGRRSAPKPSAWPQRPR